jgi:ureidoglycolate hydrolase
MKTYVDIHSHEDEGFKIQAQFQSWRTAVLNCGVAAKPESFSYVEKHKETDEIFLLLKGKAFLVIGGDGEKPDSFEVLPLDLYETYNVKIGVWHGVLMSNDASIYIVENINTGKDNSGYYNLSNEEKEAILSRVSLT